MPAFHDVRFPSSVAFGALGGPERRTQIVALASGHEERNSPWAHARRRWDVGAGVSTLDAMSELVAFFEARRGPLHGFRFADPFDNTSTTPSGTISPTDQPLGLGDGAKTTFQLMKRYASGAQTVDRPITKPVLGTVRLALDGVEQGVGAQVTIDTLTGVVTLAQAPGAGVAVTAGFAFDTPVRFENERLDVSLEAFGAGEAPRVSLVEILA